MATPFSAPALMHNDFLQSLRRFVVLLTAALVVIFPAFASAQAPPPDLQPGDTLTIVIPERDGDTATAVTIDEYNEVSLGIYGRIVLGGLSQDAAEDRLAEHMRNYLRSTLGLRLTVETRGTLVFVTGQVDAPGRYAVPRGGDVWSAIRTAGGESSTADLSGVILQRGEREIDVDLAAYLTRRSTEPLPTLEPGDVVFVPADPSLGLSDDGAGRVLDDASLAGRVFVMGAVQSPGIFNRSEGLTAISALALANGPAIDADLRGVRLITSNGSVPIDLASAIADGRPVPIEAESGVILYVPYAHEGMANPLTQGINVIGAFNTPRHLETEVALPIFEVMALAGGPSADARPRRLTHIRQGDGYTIALDYRLRRFLRRGGGLSSVLVHPGDVLYLTPDRDNVWEQFVSGISDVAVIGSAALLLVTLNGQL